MEIRLRPWQPEDSPAIYALFHAAINQLACTDYSLEQRQQWAHPSLDLAFWQQRLASTTPTVAVINGEIAGFVELIMDEAYIDCLYVHPDFARRGVGKILLQSVLNQALIARLPSLQVDVSLTAEPLFRQMGFVGLQENRHERDGVVLTNLRMKKQLLPV